MAFNFGGGTNKNVTFQVGQPSTIPANITNNGLSSLGASVIPQNNAGTGFKLNTQPTTFGAGQPATTGFGTAQSTQPAFGTTNTNTFGTVPKFGTTGNTFGTGFGGGNFGTNNPVKQGPQPSEYCAELVDASLKYDHALQMNQLQKSGVLPPQLALSATQPLRVSTSVPKDNLAIKSSLGVPNISTSQQFNRLDASFRTSAFGDTKDTFSQQTNPDEGLMNLMKKSFTIQQQKRKNQQQEQLKASRSQIPDQENDFQDNLPEPDPFYQIHSNKNQANQGGKILRYRNMYGDIEFLDRVVTPEAFNMEEIIDLRQGFVGLKDVARCPFLTGKMARITLYNINPSGGEKDLRDYCEKNGGRFIKYDQDSRQWTFDLEMW